MPLVWRFMGYHCIVNCVGEPSSNLISTYDYIFFPVIVSTFQIT